RFMAILPRQRGKERRFFYCNDESIYLGANQRQVKILTMLIYHRASLLTAFVCLCIEHRDRLLNSTQMDSSSAEGSMDLQGLNQWLAERNLKGHWDHQLWSQTVRPHLWKGRDILEGLNRAGELITTEEAGRRTIQLKNPGLAAGMTNTIHLSVQ